MASGTTDTAAHDVAHLQLPRWSVGLVPTLLVALAAPLFFVVRLQWAPARLFGIASIVVGLALAHVLRHRLADERRATGTDDTAYARPPSLLRDLSLIAVGLLIVSTSELKAALSDLDMLRFTVVLGSAVLVPYLVSRFVYRDRAISFPWRGGGRWSTFQRAWLAVVLVLGWLILPAYFITSDVYLNWPVVDTPNLVARLAIGVSAVGIWDELFFICTCFALLRRHFPFMQANVLQAVVFVSFLWELGYQAWGPLLTAPFALLQAFVFMRTRSLAYVVTVHLLFDVIVFGVMVHAHNPGLLDSFFLVSP